MNSQGPSRAAAELAQLRGWMTDIRDRAQACVLEIEAAQQAIEDEGADYRPAHLQTFWQAAMACKRLQEWVDATRSRSGAAVGRSLADVKAGRAVVEGGGGMGAGYGHMPRRGSRRRPLGRPRRS